MFGSEIRLAFSREMDLLRFGTFYFKLAKQTQSLTSSTKLSNSLPSSLARRPIFILNNSASPSKYFSQKQQFIFRDSLLHFL